VIDQAGCPAGQLRLGGPAGPCSPVHGNPGAPAMARSRVGRADQAHARVNAQLAAEVMDARIGLAAGDLRPDARMVSPGHGPLGSALSHLGMIVLITPRTNTCPIGEASSSGASLWWSGREAGSLQQPRRCLSNEDFAAIGPQPARTTWRSRLPWRSGLSHSLLATGGDPGRESIRQP